MSKINFDDFRNEYDLPSTKARIIIKGLGLEVIREGSEQYIIGENSFNVSNEYYLRQGVFEYRNTLDVKRSSSGQFIDFDVHLTDKGVKKINIEDIDPKLIKGRYQSTIQKPNKKIDKLFVDKDSVVGITNQQIPEEAEAGAGVIQVAAAGAPMAPIQALAAALVEAQKAAAPPDPLAPQKALMEAADKGFLLTTDQVGQLVGMSKSTISSKKSGFRKLGFEFTRIKEGSATLWKVGKY